ncbi:hypothetical protein KL86DYS2_10674 [uncultured Dysgonomonas sp.]|uniref:Uncharacterized protein n=1 Tax=uncultured Dysgonomonas sp. TaxID=206096 RepID=A0A212J3W1_9BACT|nr:hypothetical protein KL86DYS2_10674 [uncultured Dysgonomonas sp.]
MIKISLFSLPIFCTESSALRFDYINKAEYKSEFDKVFIYKILRIK